MEALKQVGSIKRIDIFKITPSMIELKIKALIN